LLRVVRLFARRLMNMISPPGAPGTTGPAGTLGMREMLQLNFGPVGGHGRRITAPIG
jgi:hypothetical protein